ncbi:MAG: hypothetical protein SPI30_05885 [Prevotella sp.]|nr:hypothetical protein [Prevotella sp.]
MPIVPTIGSHSTGRWYGCYQCLVRLLPVLGTDATNAWYQFNTVASSWVYTVAGLLIAAFRRSRASMYKGFLMHFLFWGIRRNHVC